MEQEFFASCLAGLESFLADELRSFDIKRVRPLKGGVAFFGTDKDAYHACLWSRLASRVVLVVARVEAKTADDLYDGVSGIPWEELLLPGASIGVHASGTNGQLRNSRFTALKTKDAIVDRLRFSMHRENDKLSRRSESTGALRASIDVRVRAQKATISLDLSGEALNHRWYLLPDDDQDAPYICSLAAGALACGGWDAGLSKEATLLETSCHDGILLVEAAAIACDLAPGLGRMKWGFEAWSHYDAEEMNRQVEEAERRFKTCASEMMGCSESSLQTDMTPDAQSVRFVGLTTSSPAITKARKHIRRAGLRALISVELGDSSDCVVAAKRLQMVGGSQQLQNVRPCVVASDLSASQNALSAQARAEKAAFMSAVRGVQGEVRAIALNGGDIAIDFPSESLSQLVLGQGRASATVDVFTSSPFAHPVITVIDLDKGHEHTVEVYEANSDQFAARFRKVLRERRKWAVQNKVSCYRIYDADLPDYAVAIDWYEGAGQARGNSYLHIAEYAPPASVDAELAKRRFSDVLSLAPVICGIRPDHVFSKQRIREKGGGQYASAGRRSYVTTVPENDLLFEVDLAQRLDTGIFLDHRPVRQRIRECAKGTRFLNLFAYTGVASVYAAAGGAASTTTVDLSQVYLDWARRNMQANGFEGPQHEFVKSDVMRWITQARRNNERFDLIFVDPPTFSNSKSMGKKTWEVQRDHVELLIGVTHLLSKDGVALFSCNLRNFKPDYDKLMQYGVELEDISAETIPEDFARTPKIHKCYLVRRALRP